MKKFVLIAILLFGTSSAHACMVPMSFEDAYAQSDYVLTGKMFGCSERDSSNKFKVEVDEIWKGTHNAIYMTTISCDSNLLKNNQKYLIYAEKTKDENTIKVSLPGSSCSRTTKVISEFEATAKNFFSMFDGNPVEVDYRIHDFEYLGNPQHIIQRKDK